MINDYVIVHRSGDVIPEVVQVLTDRRDNSVIVIEEPARCPVCDGEVQHVDDEEALRCLEINCSAKILQAMKHFCSKPCMDIDGLGVSVLEQLLDHGLITSLSDIFKLKEEDLLVLPRFGKKKAANIIEAINTARSGVSEANFLHSLGIRNVGKRMSEDLIKHFGSLQALMDASGVDIVAVANSGETTAISVVQYFNSYAAEVQELMSLVVFNQTQQVQGSSELSGKVFSFTGALSMSRPQAEKLVKEKGGEVGDVNKKTTYLVVGDKPGGSKAKAEKLGIPVINEEEFMLLLK
jgi:DNA ligase (NAD+)